LTSDHLGLFLKLGHGKSSQKVAPQRFNMVLKNLHVKGYMSYSKNCQLQTSKPTHVIREDKK